MTANELADKLINSLTMEYDCDKYMEQAATMLRQQQAEIERLGSELDRIVELYTDKAIENEQLSKELEQIKIWCGKTQFVHDYSSPFIELQKASEK
jgi:hypothetical protein